MRKRKVFQYLPGTITLMIFMFLIFAFSSCITNKYVEYLRDEDKSKELKTYPAAFYSDYKIKPNDELYIQVNSLDEAATSIFANSANSQFNTTGSLQPYGASLISHSVDKEGYVLLPVIGRIYVKDKTLQQVGDILKDSLINVLNQPIVTVKLVNRFISVLGEVRNPGHFSFSQDRLTIFDAIGLAGDITEYGNRNEVLLLRNENEKNICVNIDLTKNDILMSDYLYLRPNDIIYIKPLKRKYWGMKEFRYDVLLSSISIILSSISTAALLYSVFK
jgi:polysaccharide biosynthesis/export protein